MIGGGSLQRLLKRHGRPFAVSALVAVALCSVAALPPADSSAASAKGRLGTISFDITYKLSDSADWNFDIQEECGRSVGRGRQEITGTARAELGELAVTKSGSRIVPDPRGGEFWRDVNNLGATLEISGPASYTLNSDLEESSNSGPNCPEPIICNDCSSADPPSKSCGTRQGTLNLRPDIDYIGRTAYVRLEDDWKEQDPFSDEKANTYCPASMAIWQWGPGFPVTSTPDTDRAIKIDTNRLMGFNRLSDRQKAACGSVRTAPSGSRYYIYQRSLCGKTEPAFISKADYTRSAKTIQLRNDQAPKRWQVNQTSRLTIEYKFRSLRIKAGKSP